MPSNWVWSARTWMNIMSWYWTRGQLQHDVQHSVPCLKTLQWSRNLASCRFSGKDFVTDRWFWRTLTEQTHDQQVFSDQTHKHTQSSNILRSIQNLLRILKSILSGKPSIQTADQQNDETARNQRRAEAVCCVTNLQYSVSPRVHWICADEIFWEWI